jgi:hypothetical protein
MKLRGPMTTLLLLPGTFVSLRAQVVAIVKSRFTVE